MSVIVIYTYLLSVLIDIRLNKRGFSPFIKIFIYFSVVSGQTAPEAFI
jgi:hypothetical protein